MMFAWVSLQAFKEGLSLFLQISHGSYENLKKKSETIEGNAVIQRYGYMDSVAPMGLFVESQDMLTIYEDFVQNFLGM